MSVDIEPFELNFQRPFTQEVAQTLTIKNPNTVPVAFKVKTTAPKQYCVRPNAGRIEAGQDFDVTVLLQAFKTEPPADMRCRDKFLVQSAAITPDKEFASIANVLESTQKGLLQERKIRVNWLSENPELDQGASASAVTSTPSRQIMTNGANDTPDIARTYSSPRANEESAAPSSLPPPYQNDDVKSEPETDEKFESKSAISQATSVATSAAQATYEELKAKLAQAEAQIAALRESGLRQRKPTSADDDKASVATTATAVRQQRVEGVPVQSVAILCLVSFLLAYFFF